ncbi:cobalamin biosynthesis protein [Halomicrobium mukohataei]|uniref:Cobalamin biosynthesis protein n=1 Tax=Halomicrobium mukohataei TaxID=57705 RepID=A0A847UAU4_9EURY|nr:cobalamin biosynthesis protein [Halomicrobium mukohataei]NLV10159.1 cobalamin biosynthesis protein [Halomicrobium mukohataei]
MSDADSPDPATPTAAEDLLTVTPGTAYFWGRVAGDGDLTADCVTVRAGDETAADALAAVAGADRTDRDHRVAARESAHDASIVRYEDAYELQVFGPPADRASAALGLPLDGQPGGYRFDAFSEERAALVRGLLEACGTVCFRESAGSVGVSFVHDDERLLATIQSLLAEAAPTVPTDDRSETSSGGYWFGLADDADVAAFAEWVYAGSDETGLYSAERRQKLRRSVERATGSDVGGLE